MYKTVCLKYISCKFLKKTLGITFDYESTVLVLAIGGRPHRCQYSVVDFFFRFISQPILLSRRPITL
jgi:hypothetical protein